MNIREAKEEIIRSLKAYTTPAFSNIAPVHQRPVLLVGPPGIGKTAIMEQIARECHVGLVSYTMTHHTRQSAIGLPYIVKKSYQGQEFSITEYTMSEIIASVYACMERTGYQTGILFIDEINCVSETLTPVMLQFLQNKTFGNHPVPKGWMIVAAGNPPEYNRSVREFDIVTLDRVKYMEIEADFSVWKDYACSKGIHPAIRSYLALHEDHFYVLEKDAAGRHFVTARGWEDLSCILCAYEALGETVEDSLFLQYLQQETVARDFAMYYRLYEGRKEDLHLAEYLEGTASDAARNGLFSALSVSSLDESFGIASMVSDFLFQRLRLWKEEKDALLKLREILSQWKQKGEDFPEFLEGRKKALSIRHSNGLLPIPEAEWELGIYQELEKVSLPFLRKNLSLEEVREGLSRFYGTKQERFQGHGRELSECCKRAYELFSGAAFSEAALLYLTTDLSKNKRAVEFLSEYPCPSYLRCSEKLLVSSREEALKQAIRDLAP